MSSHGFRARLHEPGLAANPGQVACLVQLHAFDWKRVDPAWRTCPRLAANPGSCKQALRQVTKANT